MLVSAIQPPFEVPPSIYGRTKENLKIRGKSPRQRLPQLMKLAEFSVISFRATLTHPFDSPYLHITSPLPPPPANRNSRCTFSFATIRPPFLQRFAVHLSFLFFLFPPVPSSTTPNKNRTSPAIRQALTGMGGHLGFRWKHGTAAQYHGEMSRVHHGQGEKAREVDACRRGERDVQRQTETRTLKREREREREWDG